MNRAIPSLLALLLVLSLTVAPGIADPGTATSASDGTAVQNQLPTTQTDTTIEQAENTTNRLSLEGASRSEYTDVSPNLGATIASTDDELRIDHAQYVTIDRSFDEASAEERRALLEDAYDQLEAQSTALETREQRAVRAHANGTVSTAQLLQTLLRNHEEAAVLSERFGTLEARSDRVPDVSLPIEDEQDKLEMHRTEIRSQLASAVSGHGNTGDSDYIAVETSENGFVLSTLDERYVREAVRFDNRNASGQSRFDDILDAYDHAGTLYPWAYETVQSPSFNEYTTVQLYLIDNNHDQGHLEAYLDGATGKIYREVQVLNYDTLPEEASSKTSVKNGSTLSITETKGNGPAKVVVTDSETGEPKSATITIDGFEIGETGSDGSLWYVPPSGEYELGARTSPGTSNNTTVS